jgi:hypothetical protein
MSKKKTKVIRIKSPDHSRKVQKHLFSLGYKWNTWNTLGVEVMYIEKPVLVIFEDRKVISWSEKSDLYPYQELELFETVSYEFKEIPKKEVVTIGEKSYYKDELEIALKNINPI